MIQTKSVLVSFRVGSLAYCLGQPSFHIFINAAGHWTNSVLVSYSKTSQAMRASAVKQRVASIGQGTKEQTRGRSVGRTGRPIRHREQWFATFPYKQKNQSKNTGAMPCVRTWLLRVTSVPAKREEGERETRATSVIIPNDRVFKKKS